MKRFELPPVPVPLKWEIEPQEWYIEHAEVFSITAGAHTDLFTSPKGTAPVNTAPKALFAPDAEDVMVSARVEVDFRSTFDAGALLVYSADALWAKLCFEYTPQQEPMVVSVVTKGMSDDCNSVILDHNAVYLRIARIGGRFAFHYSLDGAYWHMVRHFTLGDAVANLRLGFSAQSPTGDGCTVQFSKITYARETLDDIRNGQ